MELRRKVNPPKRYDSEQPDSAHEEGRVASTNSSPPATAAATLNPNLPAAAFPTVGSAHAVGPEPTSKLKTSDLKEHQPSSRKPHHFSGHGRFKGPSSAVTPSTLTSSRKVAGSVLISLPSYFSVDETDAYPEQSNSVHNPIYSHNMRAIADIGRRSSHDWNIQEMESSDENTHGPVIVGNSKSEPGKEKYVEWGEISVAHQLEILSALLELGYTQKGAMERLGLKYHEKESLIKSQIHNQQRLAAENRQLELLRDRTHQRLMEGNGIKSGKLTQIAYKDMFDSHLGDTVNAQTEDCELTTVSELNKAQTFLAMKDIPISLVDNWSNMYGYSNQKVNVPLSEVNSRQARSLDQVTTDTALVSTTNSSSKLPRTSLPIIRKRPFSSTISEASTRSENQSQSSALTVQTKVTGLLFEQAGFHKEGNKKPKDIQVNLPQETSISAGTDKSQILASPLASQALHGELQSSGEGGIKSGPKRKSTASTPKLVFKKNRAPNRIQDSSSDKDVRKDKPSPDRLSAGIQKNGGAITLPLERLKKLTMSSKKSPESPNADDTPSSGSATPIGRIAISNARREPRSPHARRLPAKFSDSSLDQGSNDSPKELSNKKQVQKRRSTLSATSDSNVHE